MSRLLAALTFFLAISSGARGQIIAYEGFAYTVGQSLAGQNGGSGFAAPWTVGAGTATVRSGSLVPAAPSTPLAETGNSVGVSADAVTNVGDAVRTLATPIVGTPGTTAWVSVVMKGTGTTPLTSQGALVVSNGAGVGFSITTGATGGGLPPFNPPANANWSLGDAGTGAAEASSSVSDTLQSLLVARVNFGATNDAVDLFVNPPPGGSPPGSSNASLTLPHAASFSTVEIDLASVDTTSAALFDEIRLGTTFASVTPVGVPEPGTLLTVGFAGACIAARRLKRKS
jgi:hypothetical protein